MNDAGKNISKIKYSPAYFIWFWSTALRLAFFIIRSREKETKRAYNLLATIEKKYAGRFNPATLKKIAVSYGIYLPMLCNAFTRLHNRLTSGEEKNRFIHYFICSSLFDDFTDYQLISADQLQQISFQPQQYYPASFDEKVFLSSHLFLRSIVKLREEYNAITHELFQAQMDSKKQSQKILSREELQNITFKKGGNSVLLCAYYLQAIPTPVEKKCWYQTGAIIQLTNDLYDIWKDTQDGIDTLPNTMQSAYVFEKFFLEQIDEMKNLISQLQCSLHQKKIFSLHIAGICAFGFIALEQLKILQGKNERLPDFKTLSRKQLIIDMENPPNLARWFKFAYRYAKL